MIRAKARDRVPAVIQRHWNLIAAMHCMVCPCRDVQVAHAHSPGMERRGFHKGKGKKQLWQHWLVLPMCKVHHDLMDHRAEQFAAMFVDPAILLDLIGIRLGYDPYEQARLVMKVSLPQRFTAT